MMRHISPPTLKSYINLTYSCLLRSTSRPSELRFVKGALHVSVVICVQFYQTHVLFYVAYSRLILHTCEKNGWSPHQERYIYWALIASESAFQIPEILLKCVSSSHFTRVWLLLMFYDSCYAFFVFSQGAGNVQLVLIETSLPLTPICP
jgi:hypothetical protein